MLEMTDEEAYSLSLIVLKTECRKETFAGIHGFNWKKVGLSRAYYKDEVVSEDRLPTARARAAHRFLIAHNEFYRREVRSQQEVVQGKRPD